MEYIKLQWFPWLPIMQFRRMWVFGDSNEQFGTNEKLSPTSTIYVKCMKHDSIDLIYNLTLSKALLIHIYIVSIWCMTSFTIHLASNMCLYILLDSNSQVTLPTDRIVSQHIQHPYSMIQAKIKLFNFPKLQPSRASCSPIR